MSEYWLQTAHKLHAILRGIFEQGVDTLRHVRETTGSLKVGALLFAKGNTFTMSGLDWYCPRVTSPVLIGNAS